MSPDAVNKKKKAHTIKSEQFLMIKKPQVSLAQKIYHLSA